MFEKVIRKDPSSYRRRSVTSNRNRLFGNILQAKTRTAVGDKISEGQNGLISDRSCTDNLFILQQLLQKE